MVVNFDIEPVNTTNKPLIIAGPCSAETEEQLIGTAKELASEGMTDVFRAGIWKPRTRPGNFEGIGYEGLQWMKTVKEETGLSIATEIASIEHLESAMKYDFDVFWIGARTTVNPFMVQNIADALKGTDVTVMIKNPVNPDLQLWIGAIERFNQAGIKRIAAIHRGFSSTTPSVFRNDPSWNMMIDLKTMCPDLQVIVDPSHLAGKSELVSFVSQKGLDLNAAGLMIETHINPKEAWSDASQQVTPKELTKILNELVFRETQINDPKLSDKLTELRGQIDEIDENLIQLLGSRMDIVKKIGEYKKNNKVTILKVNRWDEILQKCTRLGKALNLNETYVKEILETIHHESIETQTEIMNS